MGGIAFPIFISEPNSIYAYDSVADAQIDLEPVDVEGGVYSGYDFEGRRLVLEASGVRRGWLGGIDQSKASFTITLAEEQPGHAEVLKRLLVDFLEAVERGGAALEGLSLGELALRALPHARVKVQRSWLDRRGKS